MLLGATGGTTIDLEFANIWARQLFWIAPFSAVFAFVMIWILNERPRRGRAPLDLEWPYLIGPFTAAFALLAERARLRVFLEQTLAAR